MELKGKKVLITGGSEGLGFSLAKLLIGKGCLVNIVARNADKLKLASDTINSSNLRTFVCDVSDYSQVEKAASQLGDIDILINNAGIWIEGGITDNTSEDIQNVLNTNLAGVMFVTKSFLPSMIRKNSGFIVNVSSTAGLAGRQNFSVYSASKWGVQGFTESLKLDLVKTGIRVFGFYPGGMNTEMYEKAGFSKDVSGWMSPDNVARFMMYILENSDAFMIDHAIINRPKKF